MTIPPNRRERRKAAAKVRKGRTIKSISPAAWRAQAERLWSRTQFAAITPTAQLLSGDEAAELGRRIAELASAIETMPEGSAEQQELVVEQIALMSVFQNGVRYDATAQHRIDYCMEGEPEPTRLAEPNDTSPDAEVWRSAKARYFEQTALARGLIEACAPVLGSRRAFGFAMELLQLRDGYPKMLLPARTRAAAKDSPFRGALKQLAVQRLVFDAAEADVPHVEILRRANGEDGADLISERTFENWKADTDKRDIELAERLGLASRNGTIAQLPLMLWVRWSQLCENTFPEWVRLALNER